MPIAEQKNMVFSGTLVTAGNAEIVVTAIAAGTEIVKIAKMVAEVQLPKTPLQQKMHRLSTMIGAIVVVARAGADVSGLARSNVSSNGTPKVRLTKTYTLRRAWSAGDDTVQPAPGRDWVASTSRGNSGKMPRPDN